jgi:hypothetical protein
MAVAASNISVDATGQREYIYATLTFSSNYTTGGEPFDPSVVFFAYKAAPKMPVSVSIYGANGYGYGYIPGANLAAGKLKISTGSAVELGAGAYPGGVTGDTVYIEVCTKKA